ncbi:MAG TPA: hypothetical protein VK638_54125 [Edaphobacter sp.]|nr:hypothetical protein [Edaphobacter sp.]
MKQCLTSIYGYMHGITLSKNLHFVPRETTYNDIVEFEQSWISMMSVEANGIINKKDVVLDRMPEYRFNLCTNRTLNISQSGNPPGVMAIEPEQATHH